MEPCIQGSEIAVLKEQIKVANKRIGDLEELHQCLLEISGTLRVATEQLKTMNKRLESAEQEIQTIKTAPAVEAMKIRLAVITTTIGLILGVIAQRLIS